jgi:hypothetical protein
MDLRWSAIDGKDIPEAAFPGLKTVSRVGHVISLPGVHDPEGSATRHEDDAGKDEKNKR